MQAPYPPVREADLRRWTQPTREQLTALLAAMTTRQRRPAARTALIARLDDAKRRTAGEQDAAELGAQPR